MITNVGFGFSEIMDSRANILVPQKQKAILIVFAIAIILLISLTISTY